jgi:hypothetical protein
VGISQYAYEKRATNAFLASFGNERPKVMQRPKLGSSDFNLLHYCKKQEKWGGYRRLSLKIPIKSKNNFKIPTRLSFKIPKKTIYGRSSAIYYFYLVNKHT